MSVRCSAKRIAIAACIAISTHTVGAQDPRRLAQPDSIPIDLATALIGAGSVGSEPQILVGSLPEWVTQRIVIPPGARILGSAFQGTAVVGVASVPGTSADSLMAGVRRELLSHGWKNPPPQPSYGGFRSAQMASAGVDPSRLMLCGSDDQTLTVFAAPHRGTSTTITYRLTTYAAYGPCRAQPVPPMYSRPPFPTLYNPPATADPRLMGSCEQSLNGSSGTSTAFRASLSATEILDRYARQLADSGWTAEGSGTSIVGRSWTRPDSTGAPVQVSVTVTTPARDSTCHDVNMQLRTFRKP